jgi:hypothetical protein
VSLGVVYDTRAMKQQVLFLAPVLVRLPVPMHL